MLSPERKTSGNYEDMEERFKFPRTWMGIALGVALGLIVDEAALLITLEEVYWQTGGWPSIAIAVSIIGLVGTGLILARSGAKKP